MAAIVDLKKGTRVRYVPHHAAGDSNHPDCEDGVVKSLSLSGAFVLYDFPGQKMTTGDEPFTAQNTRAEDLVILNE